MIELFLVSSEDLDFWIPTDNQRIDTALIDRKLNLNAYWPMVSEKPMRLYLIFTLTLIHKIEKP